jgi:hypothetical protein
MTMTMETGVTHSTINKKSPNLGLFSSINKYNRKQRLKAVLFQQLNDAVDKRDTKRIETICKRYFKIDKNGNWENDNI